MTTDSSEVHETPVWTVWERHMGPVYVSSLRQSGCTQTARFYGVSREGHIVYTSDD